VAAALAELVHELGDALQSAEPFQPLGDQAPHVVAIFRAHFVQPQLLHEDASTGELGVAGDHQRGLIALRLERRLSEEALQQAVTPAFQQRAGTERIGRATAGV
jgi:hypothetical protein